MDGSDPALRRQRQIDLGRQLFFDTNLSRQRNQACATCHRPGRAYSDGGHAPSGGAISVGDDGVSLGDRNAPALTYAAAAPDFTHNPTGEFRGGFFLDGRAASLHAQAGQPLVDPAEMALADVAAVAQRISENDHYRQQLNALFDPSQLADDKGVHDAALSTIVAFERSTEFFAYDSRYDRYLAGEYTMTSDEALGRELFFSDLSNCRHCHLRDSERVSPRETFTNYEYHNIGVPPNRLARSLNGLAAEYVDPGLAGNPGVDDPQQRGRFRVPSLRNVAVTGPYMHNGVFADLQTAVLFYAKYLASNSISGTNPETGEPWAHPEVADTLEMDLLTRGQPIDLQRAGYLVEFLKTLTDRRYEHVLENQ